MTEAKARAVNGPKDKFEAITIERRDVGPKDVLIEIKFAGICHSDIHTARGEWREICAGPIILDSIVYNSL